MLRDLIAFVSEKTANNVRETVLRNVNYAWKELWDSDDLPNSVFERTIVLPVTSPYNMISLPWDMDKIRGVKGASSKIRVGLSTPRLYYQDSEYLQSPFTWRLMGTSPLSKAITNATQITVKLQQAEEQDVVIAFEGPNDLGRNVRSEVTIAEGDLEGTTSGNFTDLKAVTKEVVTESDVLFYDADGVELGMIPNASFAASNQIISVLDKLTCAVCSTCASYDILYKIPCPYLYRDSTPIEYETVLAQKTLEYMQMDVTGSSDLAQLHGQKANGMLRAYNGNDDGVSHKLDLAESYWEFRPSTGRIQ